MNAETNPAKLSTTPTVDLLTRVLMKSARDDRTFTMDINGESHSFTTPYMGNGNAGYLHRYAISKYDMGEDVKKLSDKQPAGWVAVDRTVQAALILAASANVSDANPYHKRISEEKRKLIPIERKLGQLYKQKDKSDSTEKAIKNAQKEKEAVSRRVNEIWRSRFNNNDERNNVAQTLEHANELITQALSELHEQGALEPFPLSIAQKAARQLVDVHKNQLIRERGFSEQQTAIYTEFNYGEQTTNEFLRQRYGTTNHMDYLAKLINENVSGLSPSFNIDSSLIAEMVRNTPIEDDNAATSAKKKADYKGCSAELKSGRVGMKLIAKKDGITDNYNLLVAMHKFSGSGGNVQQYTEVLNSKALDPFDKNDQAFKDFLTSGNVAPYTDAARDKALQERIELDRQLQEENHKRILTENAQKLKEAKQEYLSGAAVESVSQLSQSYFDQKGIADLAVKHMSGMRIKDGKIWLPLSDTISLDKHLDTTNGYQQLLNEKVNLAPDGEDPHLTNKLFHGVGIGEKHRCFYTIGDPSTASMIIESEGIANGLIEYDMQVSRGMDVAVVCALDAGNINHAIRAIIEQHPTKPIINIADNDRFNKHGQERYVLNESDINTDLTGNEKKLENVGLKVATNLNKAVGVPFTYIDFSNINGTDFTEQQREHKLSDIDDLVKVIEMKLISDGVDKNVAFTTAYQQAGDYLSQITTDAIKTQIDPHFTLETQHQSKWVGSVKNLSIPTLQNFHFLKAAIINSQREFMNSNDKRMDYPTYKALIDKVESLDDIDLTFNSNNKQTRDISEIVDNLPSTVESAEPHIAQDIDAVDMDAMGISIPVQIYESEAKLKDSLDQLLVQISELDDKIFDKSEMYNDNPSEANERVLSRLTTRMEDLLARRDKIESEIVALNLQTVTITPTIADHPEQPTSETSNNLNNQRFDRDVTALAVALREYVNHVSSVHKDVAKEEISEFKQIEKYLVETHIEDFSEKPELWADLDANSLTDTNKQNLIEHYLNQIENIRTTQLRDDLTPDESNAIKEMVREIHNIVRGRELELAAKNIDLVADITFDTAITDNPETEGVMATSTEPEAIQNEEVEPETVVTEESPVTDAPETVQTETNDQVVDAVQSEVTEPVDEIANDQPESSIDAPEAEPVIATSSELEAKQSEEVEPETVVTEETPVTDTPETVQTETNDPVVDAVQSEVTEPVDDIANDQQESSIDAPEAEQVMATSTEPEAIQSEEAEPETEVTEESPVTDTPETPQAETTDPVVGAVQSEVTEPVIDVATDQPESTIDAPEAESVIATSSEPEAIQSEEAEPATEVTEESPVTDTPETVQTETNDQVVDAVQSEVTEPVDDIATGQPESSIDAPEAEQAIATSSEPEAIQSEEAEPATEVTEESPVTDAPETVQTETNDQVVDAVQSEVTEPVDEIANDQPESSIDAPEAEPVIATSSELEAKQSEEVEPETLVTEETPVTDTPETVQTETNDQVVDAVQSEVTEPVDTVSMNNPDSNIETPTNEIPIDAPETSHSRLNEQPNNSVQSSPQNPATEATAPVNANVYSNYFVNIESITINGGNKMEPSTWSYNQATTFSNPLSVSVAELNELASKEQEVAALQKQIESIDRMLKAVAKNEVDAATIKAKTNAIRRHQEVTGIVTNTPEKPVSSDSDIKQNTESSENKTNQTSNKGKIKRLKNQELSNVIKGATRAEQVSPETRYKQEIDKVNIGKNKKFIKLDTSSKVALKSAINWKLGLEKGALISKSMANSPSEVMDKLSEIRSDLHANNAIMLGAIISYDGERSHEHNDLSGVAVKDYLVAEMYGLEHDDKYHLLHDHINGELDLQSFYSQFKDEIGEEMFNSKFEEELKANMKSASLETPESTEIDSQTQFYEENMAMYEAMEAEAEMSQGMGY